MFHESQSLSWNCPAEPFGVYPLKCAQRGPDESRRLNPDHLTAQECDLVLRPGIDRTPREREVRDAAPGEAIPPADEKQLSATRPGGEIRARARGEFVHVVLGAPAVGGDIPDQIAVAHDGKR